MRRRHDDRGSIQIVEAIMVAILILTGMVFFTVTTRPTPQPGHVGIDLHTLAQDALEHFETTNLTDPDDDELELTLEQWVDEVVNGTARGRRVANASYDQLKLLLPEGTRGGLLLSNGQGSMVLAPDVGGRQLASRAGAVGQSVLLPNWTAHGDSAATQRELGALHAWGSYQCLQAPTGLSTAPQTMTWLQAWTATVPAKDRIPRDTLMGVWKGHTSATCTDATPATFQVVRPGTTGTPLPSYALQVVVWTAT